MDRIELSREDVLALLEWRDQNKELVRRLPCPLKAVAIVMKHNGYIIKGIRTGGTLKLYLGIDGRSMGSTMFRLRDDMMWESVPGKNKMKVEKDDLKSVLTVYCSLMALMTYAVPPEQEQIKTVHKEAHKPTRAKTAKPQKRTTYIIRHSNGTILAAPRGSHASPTGIFTVRGHFRHYKSGKVVWIAEYRKGAGKNKKKTYRIGGKNSVPNHGKASE